MTLLTSTATDHHNNITVNNNDTDEDSDGYYASSSTLYIMIAMWVLDIIIMIILLSIYRLRKAPEKPKKIPRAKQEHEMGFIEDDNNRKSNNKDDVYESAGKNGLSSSTNSNNIAPYKPVRKYVNVKEYEDVKKYENVNSVAKVPTSDDHQTNYYDDVTGDEKSKLIPNDVPHYQPRNSRIPSNSNNYEPVDSYRMNKASSKPKSPSNDTKNYSEISHYQPRNKIQNDASDYSEVAQYEPGQGAINNTNDYSEVAHYQPRNNPSNDTNSSSEVGHCVPMISQSQRLQKNSGDYKPTDTSNTPNGTPYSFPPPPAIPIYEPRTIAQQSQNGSIDIYDTSINEQKEVPKDIRDLYAVVDKTHKQKRR